MRFLFLLCLFALAINSKAEKFTDGALRDSVRHHHFVNDTVTKKKKFIAAILAFPLIGVTGIHRVYLGTQPYVPVVYMATVGGYLILPTLDFIAIICADEKTFLSYQNNPHIFMWVR